LGIKKQDHPQRWESGHLKGKEGRRRSSILKLGAAGGFALSEREKRKTKEKEKKFGQFNVGG